MQNNRTNNKISPVQLSRMRSSQAFRNMVRQTVLTVNDLIQPVFVHYGNNVKNEIVSMPGQYQLSIDMLRPYLNKIVQAGINAILLFGIPEHKDPEGSNTWDDQNGIIQQAVREIKKHFPQLVVITDVCFCEYTSHGHCGILRQRNGVQVIDQSATLDKLALQVASHARAGADMVAPSGMIDNQVRIIRETLDGQGFCHIPIMSYAAKYASSFYGPFRDAANGGPQFGDRRSQQMDPANSNEALREVHLDITEGADIVMIKPALAYMDIIRRVRDTFDVPVAAYNVSGEYAMVKAAAANGWINEKDTVLEILTSIKRAGADIIITYHALQVAKWLQDGWQA